MSQDNWTPIYSICPDTGLRVCEIYQFLLVREDGMIKTINPKAFRAKKIWNNGSSNGKGYRQFSHGTKTKKIHSLVAKAFLQNYSDHLCVDHINGIRDDNRASNIRLVDNRENCQNRIYHRNGKLIGASYHASSKKWRSLIRINGKQTSLGYFSTEEEASKKYVEFLEQLKKAPIN